MEGLKLKCKYSDNDNLQLEYRTIGTVCVICNEGGEYTEITLSEENAKLLCENLKKNFGWH